MLQGCTLCMLLRCDMQLPQARVMPASYRTEAAADCFLYLFNALSHLCAQTYAFSATISKRTAAFAAQHPGTTFIPARKIQQIIRP